jgi:hypothetical protein
VGVKMSKKKYLYECVSNTSSCVKEFSINYSLPSIKDFNNLKEVISLHKSLISFVVCISSLLAVFVFGWVFLLVLIPFIVITAINFSSDYKLLKLKEDFEENGIF